VGRRLEQLGEARRVVVYDDYRHHPTAIRETLAAVRQREPGRPIWAVYEPLTYHRTAAMLDEFAEVLATAHGAVIADVWAGRDSDTSVTSAQALARAVHKQRRDIPAEAPGNVEETADWLAAHVRPNDAVPSWVAGAAIRSGACCWRHWRDDWTGVRSGRAWTMRGRATSSEAWVSTRERGISRRLSTDSPRTRRSSRARSCAAIGGHERHPGKPFCNAPARRPTSI
jgi:hypothetical protein